MDPEYVRTWLREQSAGLGQYSRSGESDILRENGELQSAQWEVLEEQEPMKNSSQLYGEHYTFWQVLLLNLLPTSLWALFGLLGDFLHWNRREQEHCSGAEIKLYYNEVFDRSYNWLFFSIVGFALLIPPLAWTLQFILRIVRPSLTHSWIRRLVTRTRKVPSLRAAEAREFAIYFRRAGAGMYQIQLYRLLVLPAVHRRPCCPDYPRAFCLRL